MKNRDTLYFNEKGRLIVGGCDAEELAKSYGTPLYVMDEEHIRRVCRGYKEALKNEYPNSLVCYASKAFSCVMMYSILKSEGLGADVVSGGELFTALKSGLDPKNIYFHGNNKLERELGEAVTANVGTIVIDSNAEIELLNKIAKEHNKIQNVLIRVNPGIDAHTHHFVQTTRVDSKFGFAILGGDALKAVGEIINCSNLDFKGVHTHIGSQIFDVKPFELAVEKMTDLIALIKKEYNIDVSELNLGGGYGIVYTDEDRPLEPKDYVLAIVKRLKSCIKEKSIIAPRLIIEPGRSIVGEAGITLYTVGGVKDIKNIRTYVSVDGGMFENPRFALYEAKYEAVKVCDNTNLPLETVTIAGKCCESGDMIAVDIKLPPVKRGDVIATLSTGAYNFSMASNYNRNAVPPVVIVKDGKSRYMVRPQSYADIISRDVT